MNYVVNRKSKPGESQISRGPGNPFSYVHETDESEAIIVCEFSFMLDEGLKALFHSSQKPTPKFAARTFIQSQYLKALAVSLRVGFCDEWKRRFKLK